MISIFAVDRRPRLGALVLDISITEEVSFESDVSIYLVEDGSTKNDHITQGPERFRISGVIPASDAMSFITDVNGAARMADVVETARAMHRERAVVDIATGQVIYPNMAFTSLRVARTAAETGEFISVEAEAVRIEVVNLRTAEVPAEQKTSPAGGAQGRAGQTNKPAGRGTTNANATGANGAGGGAGGPGESILSRNLGGEGPLGEAVRAARGVFGR